jgi:hypothetical protein
VALWAEFNDLFLLFGKEAFDNIPKAWKEFRAMAVDQDGLEELFADVGGHPIRYSPDCWYLYIPKTRDYVIWDVDLASRVQWVWYLPEDDEGGIPDRKLRQYLGQALRQALELGVTSLHLTWPPLPPRARPSQQETRTRLILKFMQETERVTPILVGMFRKDSGL